jgi:hypothetical protein
MTRSFSLEAVQASEYPEMVKDFLAAEAAREPGPLQHRSEIDTDMVRTVMEHLGVQPVWGRQGTMTYSLDLDGRVLVFSIVPDPGKDLIQPEFLTREWEETESLTELIEAVDAWCRGHRDLEGLPAEVVAEDHPEENAIGFFAPAINRVWLLPVDILTKNLMEGDLGRWAAVPHLIQSSTGRAVLAQMLADGKLQSQAEFLRSLSPQNPAGPSSKRRSEIIIDLMSGQIAERFKTRYLKGGQNAPEA